MQEIYVDDIGTGFPLVLVHGFLGSSAMWSPQKDFLSKYYRLIAPALPGFGESSNIKSLDSINAMAKSILKILEKKEIKKCLKKLIVNQKLNKLNKQEIHIVF